MKSKRSLGVVAVVGLMSVVAACGGDDSGSSSGSESGGAAKTPTVSAPESIDPWTVTPGVLGMTVGDTGVFACPADGLPGTLWGDKEYTDDSSICTAAVYEGLISLADGGVVEFRVTEGLDEYPGGEANGITSQPYDAWGQSFVLVD